MSELCELQLRQIEKDPPYTWTESQDKKRLQSVRGIAANQTHVHVTNQNPQTGRPRTGVLQ